jgi:hypothetical protein
MMDDNITRLEINRVQMFNPETEQEEQLKKIDFEGNNIENHPNIRERRNNGWVMRGLTTRVEYQNAIFDVTIGGNDVMGYVKVEDIGDYDQGQELIQEIRERFLEYLRR